MLAQRPEIDDARIENLQRARFHAKAHGADVAHLQFLGVLREPAKDLRDERRDGFRLPRGRHGPGDEQTILEGDQGAGDSRQGDGLVDYLVRRPVFLVRFLEKLVETLRPFSVRKNGGHECSGRMLRRRCDRS